MEPKKVHNSLDRLVAAFHKVTDYLLGIPKGEIVDRAAEDEEVRRLLYAKTEALVPAVQELLVASVDVLSVIPEPPVPECAPLPKKKRVRRAPAKLRCPSKKHKR